jgi:hypothetical protein
MIIHLNGRLKVTSGSGAIAHERFIAVPMEEKAADSLTCRRDTDIISKGFGV